MTVIRSHKLELWFSRTASSAENTGKWKKVPHLNFSLGQNSSPPVRPRPSPTHMWKLYKNMKKRKTKARKKVQATCHFHWLGSGPIMDTALVGWAHTSMQKGQKIERKASGWRSFSLAGLRSITGKVTDGRHTHTYTNQKGLEAGETKISAQPENQQLFVHLSRASHLQFNVKAFKSEKKKKRTSLKLRGCGDARSPSARIFSYTNILKSLH